VNSGEVGIGGTSSQQFRAILPDGSPMEIDIIGNDSFGWSGDFAVSAETGPFAFQVGRFHGSITGTSIAANCITGDGTEFTLNGTANGSSRLSLTRSDIPGIVLDFELLKPPATLQKPMAEVGFTLNTGKTSGRLTISDQPFYSDPNMKRYRGTWQGLPAQFVAYSNGSAWVDSGTESAYSLTSISNYRLTDFATATRSSNSGEIGMYPPVGKEIRYPFAGCKVSP